MDNSSSSNSSKSGRYQNDRKTVFGELQRKFVGALQEVEDQVVIKGSYNRRIFTFLDDILGLERINPNINRKEKGHKILPQAMIMKAFLDLDVLRALCLMPPEGCSLERWQCLAGPCRSNIHIKCHDVRSVKALLFSPATMMIFQETISKSTLRPGPILRHAASRRVKSSRLEHFHHLCFSP